jgi:hypothetical protein
MQGDDKSCHPAFLFVAAGAGQVAAVRMTDCRIGVNARLKKCPIKEVPD